MPKMPIEPEWLRANAIGAPAGVDRKANMLRGYVVAQLGPFKSKGRGEFDRQSLEQIVAMGNATPNGLKSRFTHPDESSDGLGKHLGRARDFAMGTALDERTGKLVDAVRANLHFDPSAFSTPSGDLAGYIMNLAESDPAALSSSLVLKTKKEVRLNPDGTPQLDTEGEPLPPLWRPSKLHASDIVDTGDAVDGILSAEANGIDVDGLPLAALWRGAELLDSIFAEQPREVIEARCRAWLDRYLTARFGESMKASGQDVATLQRKLELKLKSRM